MLNLAWVAFAPSGQRVKPAEDVLFGFVLNARQGIVEFQRGCTGRTVAEDFLLRRG